MSVVHLDTNFLIVALAGSREGPRVLGWVRSGDTLAMSAVAWAEFMCGPLPEGAEALARRIVTDIVPIGAPAAERAAALFNAGGRRRGVMMDCLIAACAIEADEPLATANTADFARFRPHGLRLAE